MNILHRAILLRACLHVSIFFRTVDGFPWPHDVSGFGEVAVEHTGNHPVHQDHKRNADPDWSLCEFDSADPYNEDECENGAVDLYPCLPGQLKVRPCIGQDGDTSRACDPCPQKFFQRKYNKCTLCHQCSECDANEKILNPCTDESDTECAPIGQPPPAMVTPDPPPPAVVTPDPPESVSPTTRTTVAFNARTTEDPKESGNTFQQTTSEVVYNGLTTNHGHMVTGFMSPTQCPPVACAQVNSNGWAFIAVTVVALLSSVSLVVVVGVLMWQCVINRRLEKVNKDLQDRLNDTNFADENGTERRSDSQRGPNNTRACPNGGCEYQDENGSYCVVGGGDPQPHNAIHKVVLHSGASNEDSVLGRLQERQDDRNIAEPADSGSTSHPEGRSPQYQQPCKVPPSDSCFSHVLNGQVNGVAQPESNMTPQSHGHGLAAGDEFVKDQSASSQLDPHGNVPASESASWTDAHALDEEKNGGSTISGTVGSSGDKCHTKSSTLVVDMHPELNCCGDKMVTDDAPTTPAGQDVTEPGQDVTEPGHVAIDSNSLGAASPIYAKIYKNRDKAKPGNQINGAGSASPSSSNSASSELDVHKIDLPDLAKSDMDTDGGHATASHQSDSGAALPHSTGVKPPASRGGSRESSRPTSLHSANEGQIVPVPSTSNGAGNPTDTDSSQAVEMLNPQTRERDKVTSSQNHTPSKSSRTNWLRRKLPLSNKRSKCTGQKGDRDNPTEDEMKPLKSPIMADNMALDDFLDDVAYKLKCKQGDRFFRKLGMTDTAIDNSKYQYKDEKAKEGIFKTLTDWRGEEGIRATYRRVITALNDSSNKDVAHTLIKQFNINMKDLR